MSCTSFSTSMSLARQVKQYSRAHGDHHCSVVQFGASLCQLQFKGTHVLIVQGPFNWYVDVIAYILVFFLMTQDAQFQHREVCEAGGRHDLYKHMIKFRVTRISITASSSHPLWCFFLRHMCSWSIEPILLSSILADPSSLSVSSRCSAFWEGWISYTNTTTGHQIL